MMLIDQVVVNPLTHGSFAYVAIDVVVSFVVTGTIEMIRQRIQAACSEATTVTTTLGSDEIQCRTGLQHAAIGIIDRIYGGR